MTILIRTNKKGEKKYRASVYYKGKQIYKTFSSLKQAKAWRARKEILKQEGGLEVELKKSPTVSEYCDYYIDHISLRLSKTT